MRPAAAEGAPGQAEPDQMADRQWRSATVVGYRGRSVGE
mgnify:CR=1 FL=1